MSNKLKFSSHYSDSNNFHEVSIGVVQFKDSGNQVIFAPALEVYGYGKTVKDARDSFGVCLQEFLEYTESKGTLKKELKRLGGKLKVGPGIKSIKFQVSQIYFLPMKG